MKVTLDNTDKIVTLVINGVDVPARIWEGRTAKGIRCHAFITCIAVHEDDDAGEFERDLKEQRPPSAEIRSVPLRMVID